MNSILVVDDETDILELIKTILVGNGYNVTTATNGEEALVKAVQLKPDIIILDIVMPGLSGLEVCRLLKGREDMKRTPVIVMSVLNREVDLRLVKEAGADEFLHKPFNMDQLLIALDNLQNKYSSD